MLTLLVSLLILPADTVSGRVVDNVGQPVPQAIVEITQLGRSVTASAEGAFRLSVAPGRYTLAVRRHGFAPVLREISVGAGQPALEIVLTPSAFPLAPLTVPAPPAPLPAPAPDRPRHAPAARIRELAPAGLRARGRSAAACAGRLARARRGGAARRPHHQYRRANQEARDSRIFGS